MKRNITFLTSMILLVLCFSVSIFAQEQFGNIEGTVKDPNGAVVPSATVTVKATGATSGFNRTVTADSQGFFRVLNVPAGSYDVTSTASGFAEAKYNNVTVTLGKTTPVEVALPIGTSVSVDVTLIDQPVDPTDNEVSTSVSAAKIELLPKGVSFTSVLKTVPGTRGEGLAGGFSVDGASGSENSFIIDGQEVSNFRTGTLNGNNNIPTQFVQEVQVKSSGFDAEFGGATGGVINVVTKGGGNEFRGEFGMQFETPKLNGGNRPSLLRFTSGSGATFAQTTEYINAPKSSGTNVFPTANLSGRIIKDKLWFFGSYTPQVFVTENNSIYYSNTPAATRTITATETYRLKRKFEYGFLRLDASPTDKLRLSGTYTWNPIIDQGALPVGTVSLGGAPPTTNFGGSIGTLTGRQLTDRQGGRQNSTNVTAQAVWTPTSNFVMSGRFSRGFLNERLGSYFVPTGVRNVCQSGNVGTTTYPGACTQGFAGPANTVINKEVSIRNNYEVDATYLTNFGGKHEFKGGYQRFNILNDVDRGYVDTGRVDFYYGFTIEDLGAPVTSTPGAIGAGELIRIGTKGRGENTNQSLYIQDKWQPTSRLSLNIGVRAEKEDLPSFNGLAPPINFGFGDKIAPRLGFAFDLFGTGKTRLFASYGRFLDRLKFELPRGSFGGDFYRVDFFEIFANTGSFDTITPARILGNFNDRSGGLCPTTGFIGTGLSRCQFDYRIASNSAESTIFTGAVDPELKPFRQSEFTVGFEHQLGSDYVIRSRYTYKNVDQAIEDAGIINAQGSEAYIIGNPGSGLHLQLLNELGYTKSTKPQRRYDGLEFVFEKRLSNNYYFNANYTYSRLYGNYSGLASSDEAGRTSPGVNRFFDLPFIGFTAAGNPDNGRLATDRPHVFNAYGAYIFDWKGSKTNSTELSFFTTAQSGTPQTSTITFITGTIFTERGDLGRTEMLTQTDFNVTHRYRFGRDNRFTAAFDLNFLNFFNEANVTSLFNTKTAVTLSPTTFGFTNPDGSPNYVGAINAYTSGSLLAPINTYLQGTATAKNRTDARYGQPNGYQGPRSVRFGFRLLF